MLLVSCKDCEIAVPCTGERGPPPLRCDGCRREARKQARRRKNGVIVPLGSEIKCQTCGSSIERTASTRSFCKICALSRRRARDRETYFIRNGQAPKAGIGTLANCVDCSKPFVRTRADHELCDVCSRARVNAYNRRARNADRRTKGTPSSVGTTICDQCKTEFRRQAANAKYCQKCRNQPRIRYARRRRKIDVAFALNAMIGAAIRKSLHATKDGRSWESLVGYSLHDLMQHIGRQFLPRMTWSNRGEWHIDHIVPLKFFRFNGPDDPSFKSAWALTNLRPLWRDENLRKSGRRTHLL